MFLKFSKTKVLPFGVPYFGIPAANGYHVFMEGDRIDEAVLALLYLGIHKRHNTMAGARTWKSFDWGAMGRLHRKGLITDPVPRPSRFYSPNPVCVRRKLHSAACSNPRTKIPTPSVPIRTASRHPVRRWTAGNASARSFRPSAPTTLRTVSNDGTRSPESAL